jgi:hypothetical protein
MGERNHEGVVLEGVHAFGPYGHACGHVMHRAWARSTEGAGQAAMASTRALPYAVKR